MRIDPNLFAQSGALSNALAKSRSEALEARRVFDTIIGSPSQRPVPTEDAPPVSFSAQREKEVADTRMTRMAEVEKENEEEPTPSPDPTQRPGRVLDIRV
jgi:hypothetical protein